MPAGKVIDETDKVTRRILDINLTGVWHGIRAVVPTMTARQAGSELSIGTRTSSTLRVFAPMFCTNALDFGARGLSTQRA